MRTISANENSKRGSGLSRRPDPWGGDRPVIYERTVTRPVPPAGPTKPITDWSDKFLSQKWPFANGLPLPDVDSARKSARDQASHSADSSNLDGLPTMHLSCLRREETLQLPA